MTTKNYHLRVMYKGDSMIVTIAEVWYNDLTNAGLDWVNLTRKWGHVRKVYGVLEDTRTGRVLESFGVPHH